MLCESLLIMHTVGSNTKGILRKEEMIQGVKEEVVQGKGSVEGNNLQRFSCQQQATVSVCGW